jgi:hypothetical protein
MPAVVHPRFLTTLAGVTCKGASVRSPFLFLVIPLWEALRLRLCHSPLPGAQPVAMHARRCHLQQPGQMRRWRLHL